MSFQNKLFKMNLKVAIIPIIFFVSMIFVLLCMFRHAFYKSLSTSDITDSNIATVTELLKKTDTSKIDQNDFDFDQYNKNYRNLGFSIAILKDQELLYSNFHKETSYLTSYIKTDIATVTETPIITTYNKQRQVFYHTIYNGVNYYFMARSSISKFSTLLSTDTFFYAFVFFLIILIFFIFSLCEKYSKRLTNQLMLPIDQLGEGAKRIQQGNLDIQLNYVANDEFRPVFETFNEMQNRLKDSILTTIDREKDQQEMLAEISHDLKTPLTAIKGYVKGLEDGVASTPEKKARYLMKIRKKTDEMARLIDEILMFSRLTRNKIEFTTIPLAIDKYLGEVISTLQGDNEEQSFEIIFEPGATTSIVELDQIQFNRVLENIIENSKKYSGRDHTIVTIRTKRLYKKVEILIKDNGDGVAEDKLPHIFDTFYRTDDSRNQSTNGTGLGLAIVKHIIQKLSGSIEASNQDGLCITITLKEAQHETHIDH